MQSELTERAKTAWNSIADEFNQWDALGLDEQETYVALTAALSAEQTQPFAVKALEWVDADEGMCTKWRSAALGGHYELVDFGKDDPGFAVNFHWGRPLSFWFIQGEPDERGPTGPKMFPTFEAAKAAAQADYEQRIRSALVDVPAVEPVAHIIEGLNGEDPRVYLTQKYDPRSPDFWLNEEARAKHRVTPLYTSPPLSREGEDSAEVYRQALERIANASARGWNVETATEALNTARAIAATALAATRSGSATTASGIAPAGRNALDKERG